MSALKGVVSLIENGIELDFTHKKVNHALAYAAAYPILAAFRLLVEYDAVTEQYKWKDGGLEKALSVWIENAPDLITTIRRADHKTMMMLGRDPGIWESIYTKIALVLLQQKVAAQA